MENKNIDRQKHFSEMVRKYLASLRPEEQFRLEGVDGGNSPAAWFLGPRAENLDFFLDLINDAVKDNADDRQKLYPNDPPYISGARKDGDYYEALGLLRKEYIKLRTHLKKSVPFFSYRYQAHMLWDLTLPSMLGYFAAMLYNQNNVALEASPVTSYLEQLVGDDLCRMLGYSVPDAGDTSEKIRPWGHITCDGSVANLEAVWAVRNLKYYPLSIRAALQNVTALKSARDLQITPYKGGVPIILSDPKVPIWTLLNVDVDVILGLPDKIRALCGPNANTPMTPEEFSALLEPYLLQTVGIVDFLRKYGEGTNPGVILGPATRHYSWPKNTALAGLGKDKFITIPVDEDARMSWKGREGLEDRLKQLAQDKKTPVLAVMAVLGSTEESAVDPLADVLRLREKYRAQGLDFAVHVDAAWGGYFASMLRNPKPDPRNAVRLQDTPALSMSQYVFTQYEALPGADSITIDPHKAGYVPYPAGGLCYRNKMMRNMVAFEAPAVLHNKEELDANMGIYGVEGSKPGAAAASVYLSHRVIRPDKSGYGRILGQAIFNSKRFYAAVVTMAEEADDFVVVPVQQLPAERQHKSPEKIKEQLRYIKEHLVQRPNGDIVSNADIVQDLSAFEMLKELGSDLNIITYGINFKVGRVLNGVGKPNTSAAAANQFMLEIYKKLSLTLVSETMPELFVTTSQFDVAGYGEEFVRTYMQRLGLSADQPLQTMNFLSSTTMSPWLTAAATETDQGNFIPTLIKAFRAAIKAVPV